MPADQDFIVGVETVQSSINSFILAMMLFPAVQKRLHDELDVFVSRWSRLPLLTDRDHLPYVNACILETLRWQPATPLGVYCHSSPRPVSNNHQR
jgi:cytochrome P450